MRQILTILATTLLALACASSAHAVIEALTPLKKFQADATGIVTARVEKLDLEKQTAVLTLEQTIAGELASPRLPMRLAGDSEGDPADMIDRLEVGQRLVLFVTDNQSQIIGYAYTRGSWFQIIGTRDGERVRWQFTHAEPYLRRTFHGETLDLVKLLQGAAEGKELPEPDEQEQPGLGPKIDRSAVAIVEPALPAAPAASPAGPTTVTVVAPTTSFDSRPWYAFAATVVIGLAGIVYLRLRGGPTA